MHISLNLGLTKFVGFAIENECGTGNTEPVLMSCVSRSMMLSAADLFYPFYRFYFLDECLQFIGVVYHYCKHS